MHPIACHKLLQQRSSAGDRALVYFTRLKLNPQITNEALATVLIRAPQGVTSYSTMAILARLQHCCKSLFTDHFESFRHLFIQSRVGIQPSSLGVWHARRAPPNATRRLPTYKMRASREGEKATENRKLILHTFKQSIQTTKR